MTPGELILWALAAAASVVVVGVGVAIAVVVVGAAQNEVDKKK